MKNPIREKFPTNKSARNMSGAGIHDEPISVRLSSPPSNIEPIGRYDDLGFRIVRNKK